MKNGTLHEMHKTSQRKKKEKFWIVHIQHDSLFENLIKFALKCENKMKTQKKQKQMGGMKHINLFVGMIIHSKTKSFQCDWCVHTQNKNLF